MIALLVYAGIFAGSLVTIVGGLAPILPAADGINHFRPWLLGLSGLLVLLAFWSNRRAAKIASLGLAAIQALLFALPLMWRAEVARIGPASVPAKRHITLINFNMAWAQRPVDDVATFLLEQDADIVLLQEVTTAHASSLHPRLEARYPHYHACGLFQGCTQAIFSKRPWTMCAMSIALPAILK